MKRITFFPDRLSWRDYNSPENHYLASRFLQAEVRTELKTSDVADCVRRNLTNGRAHGVATSPVGRACRMF